MAPQSVGVLGSVGNGSLNNNQAGFEEILTAMLPRCHSDERTATIEKRLDSAVAMTKEP